MSEHSPESRTHSGSIAEFAHRFKGSTKVRVDAGSRAGPGSSAGYGWGPEWRPAAAGSGADGRGTEGDRVVIVLSLEAERGCAVRGQWSVVWACVCMRVSEAWT